MTELTEEQKNKIINSLQEMDEQLNKIDISVLNPVSLKVYNLMRKFINSHK